jgi:hypothetical protein
LEGRIRIRVSGITVLAIVLYLVACVAPADAVFHGANGQIAFSTSRDGNFEVYSMDVSGAGQTDLTNNAAKDFNCPLLR